MNHAPLVLVLVRRASWALWATSMMFISSYLLARHLLTLPVPATADPALAAALERSRAPAERGRWLALHVLLGDCPCSRRVAEHLLRRGPLVHVQGALAERVALIGPAQGTDLTRALSARGFAVEPLSPAALAARYPIEAAPLLLVADPEGSVRYIGGYSARKQGPSLLDVAILRDLVEGRSAEPLPAFGCPISESLRAALDPLRLSTTPSKDPD